MSLFGGNFSKPKGGDSNKAINWPRSGRLNGWYNRSGINEILPAPGSSFTERSHNQDELVKGADPEDGAAKTTTTCTKPEGRKDSKTTIESPETSQPKSPRSSTHSTSSLQEDFRTFGGRAELNNPKPPKWINLGPSEPLSFADAGRKRSLPDIPPRPKTADGRKPRNHHSNEKRHSPLSGFRLPQACEGQALEPAPQMASRSVPVHSDLLRPQYERRPSQPDVTTLNKMKTKMTTFPFSKTPNTAVDPLNAAGNDSRVPQLKRPQLRPQPSSQSVTKILIPSRTRSATQSASPAPPSNVSAPLPPIPSKLSSSINSARIVHDSVQVASNLPGPPPIAPLPAVPSLPLPSPMDLEGANPLDGNTPRYDHDYTLQWAIRASDCSSQLSNSALQSPAERYDHVLRQIDYMKAQLQAITMEIHSLKMCT